MISIGENKASLCKGNFHPAELYKGDKKIAGYITTEFSGEGSVTLENCYNDRLHSTKLIGNSIQESEPTPESPVEVQSVGELQTDGEYAGKYKIPVKVRGKNLWNGVNYIESNSINTVCTQYVYASSNDWVKSGVTVTVSATVCVNDVRTNMRLVVFAQYVDGSSSEARIVYYSVKGKEIRVYAKYTIPQTDKELQRFVIRPCDYSVNDSGIWDAYVKDIQIELGDTATPYEPYIEPQTYDIYLDEPLHKIGEYADYIDFDKDIVVRNLGEVTVTSDMVVAKNSWYYQINWNAYEVNFRNFEAYFNQWHSGDFSNYFKATPGGYTSASLGANYVFQVSGNKVLYIITTPASDETVAEIKAWVDEKYNEGKPLVFTLRRKEPIEEPIDLPKLPVFKGTTIYEVNTQITATVSGKYKEQEG